MRRNYYRKLAASIYHHAKNVGIIGILPYPYSAQVNRHVPLPFRGKRAENCSHNEVILLKMKYLRIHNIGIHINFYQNRFINESVRKNFLKISDVKT